MYTYNYIINYISLIFLLTGGAVDGPFNGAAPTPWSIPIQPEQMFRNHEKSCEVSDLFKMSLWNTPPEILVILGCLYTCIIMLEPKESTLSCLATTTQFKL